MPAHHRSPALCLAVALLVAAGLAAMPAYAGEPADRVLGQVGFQTTAANLVDGRGFSSPQGIAIDRSATPHRIWVADHGNSRVLGWRDIARFYRGAPADLVLGRPDAFVSAPPFNSDECSFAVPVSADRLCGPTAIAVDPAGNLFVVDEQNRRVVEFDDPFANDRVADRVFGQPDLTSRGEGIRVHGLAIDRDGNLYTIDALRLQIYESPLVDQEPDLVHQSDPGCPGRSEQTTLCAPFALTVDAAGDLYVADGFARLGLDGVWVFRRPLATDLVPDLLIDGSPARIDGIRGLAVDAAGALYVAAILPNGVFVYQPPLAAGALPAVELPARLPIALALDGDALLVSDLGRHAVLRYPEPRRAGATLDLAVGQLDLAATAPNRVDRRGLFAPRAVAVDASVTPSRLWAFDAGNSRVLGWRDASGFGNGAPADLVIGQPGPGSSGCRVGRADLCLSPARGGGLAVDERGTLFVADTDNHRVLVFESPFDTDQIADRVIGQGGSFSERVCALSARGLCYPGALALDARGTLWVADTGSHRVLAFRDAATGDDVADRVLGQRNRFSTGVCGHGPRGLCLSHEQGLIDQIVGGSGLAVDRSGTLYVSDTDNNRVLAFDDPIRTDTVADRVWGPSRLSSVVPCSAAPVRFCGPMGLALDDRGGLWVADRGNSRVLRLDARRPNARPLRLLGGVPDPSAPPATSAATLVQPAAVAVDDAGSVFVADTGNHRVLAFDEP